MKTGQAIPIVEASNSLQFPACGVPLTGHEIRVVDESDRELPDRQQGRLEFRGPSTTSGYYRNPEQSQKLFHDDWLNSGDLAYVANGELYITGRIKDIIIHAGRNIYPHELEHAVGNLEGIRKGCVAVFGSHDHTSGTELLVVLAESKVQDSEDREKLISQVNTIATALIGSPADKVVLAAPHTVLKTSSGKIRRTSCREIYEQGLIGSSLPQKIKLYFSHLLLSLGLPKLKRRLDLVMTRLYGVYAWTLLLFSTVIVWPLVAISPRRWSWPILRFSFRVLAWGCNTKVTIQGLKNLNPKQGPFIFVCNHASYLDGMMLILAIPMELSFIAKAELGQQLIAGTILRKLGARFVERFDTQQSINDAKKVTASIIEGHSLLFFPEGTFTRIPGLLPFRMGAFTTAATSARPVLPITIRGTRSILRAQTWLPRKGSVTVSIGAVIVPNSISPNIDHNEIWNAAVKLRDAAREQILKHNGEPDLSDEVGRI